MMKLPLLNRSTRRNTLLAIATVVLYGCSGSSSTTSDQTLTNEVVLPANSNNGSVSSFDVSASAPPIEPNDSVIANGTSPQTTAEPSTPATIQVGFDISVPAYMSDDLHMRLVWGDIEITGQWVYGEDWVVFHEFPADTENQLEIIFSDSHGNITLASYSNPFRTATSESQILKINADQFNESPWDNDNDGRSNLDELLAGTNPDVADAPYPVQPTLSFEQDKTFRLTWQTTPTAQTYRVLENPDGSSGFTDVSGTLGSSTQTYDHRVALYTKINAQYLVQSCRDDVCTDSEIIAVSGTMEGAIGYFKASNTDAPDCFGTAVSLSADGNTMAVSAIQEASSASGINGNQDNNSLYKAGAVYVFNRKHGQWSQQAYIKSADPQEFDNFGIALSLTADGNTLAVGGQQSEKVYLYERHEGEWQQSDTLSASNSEKRDFFGSVLQLSADGNTIAISAIGESSGSTGVDGNQVNNDVQYAGAVYVFDRRDGAWQQQAYLKASNSDLSDRFGNAVSLSEDGNTLAVGAAYEERAASDNDGFEANNSGFEAGATYIFVRANKIWSQQAHLRPSVSDYPAQFGKSVSISADGKTLAIGANKESVSSGAVYVFTESHGLWNQQAHLKASNASKHSNFGISVSLSMDGNTLAVGSDFENSNTTGINAVQNNASSSSSGAVYTFVRYDGYWEQQSFLKASNTNHNDRFGRAVSISMDGNTLAVGAVNEQSAATGINGDQSNNSLRGPGAVYIY